MQAHTSVTNTFFKLGFAESGKGLPRDEHCEQQLRMCPEDISDKNHLLI